jgi:hypothetical protein
MDRSIDNRTLTHLLSVSRRTTESTQLLRHPHTIGDRNGSRGQPIGGLKGNRILNGELTGSTGQGLGDWIPDQTRRGVGARKLHRVSIGAGTCECNRINRNLLNPIGGLNGTAQGQSVRGDTQRPFQRRTAFKHDQLGWLHISRTVGECLLIADIRECKSSQCRRQGQWSQRIRRNGKRGPHRHQRRGRRRRRKSSGVDGECEVLGQCETCVGQCINCECSGTPCGYSGHRKNAVGRNRNSGHGSTERLFGYGRFALRLGLKSLGQCVARGYHKVGLGGLCQKELIMLNDLSKAERIGDRSSGRGHRNHGRQRSHWSAREKVSLNG